MTTLQDKRCFLTGAASGIGRATALAAAAKGAVLFLTDLDAVRLEATVRDIRAAGGKVAAHRALDVSDYEAVQAFAEVIHDEFGSMDVVMNIAGISVWGAVDSLEHRHWRQVIDVNLMGPIHVIESFVPDMIRAGRGGHLVNVSSAAGLFGLPFHAAYSGAKFGLRGVSEVLRFDLERHGIEVTLVCPGAVNTGLVETIQIVGAGLSQEEFDRLREDFRRRAVTPETAARAILRGVTRNEYLVFTSNETRIGHWVQRKVGFLYERTMRKLNDRLYRAAKPLPPTRGHRRGTEARAA
ncbi:MAG: SDR family oxidoreductase [Deltaproteobacteria bacterium]|nr:SDR family oxidoreductase [Deltaproteobacteria bacterium]